VDHFVNCNVDHLIRFAPFASFASSAGERSKTAPLAKGEVICFAKAKPTATLAKAA
jgi:hypothetical protein